MERYLGGEEIDEAVLIADLEKAVARASFFPVIPVCSGSGVGTLELLEIATRGFPSPPEHRLPEVFSAGGAARKPMACDPGGPLLAEVVKTTSDPYVGRVSLVRVFSGTIRPDATVHVSGHFSAFNDAVAADGSHGHADHDEDERIGTLSFPLGKQQRPAPAVVAGDICAIGRLSRAETGDTLSDKVDPLVLRPWTMPDPLLPVAVQPRAKTDEDKLSVGLQRLAAEDPTLRIEQNPETHQIVLWCMGEAHAGVVLDALSRRYGVSVDTVELRVPLRETLGGKAKGHGRHVKQSGGHGQYAVCDIEVEPLPEGSGFEFVDKVVGGAVPRQFIPSVEKGVRAQMEKGVGSEVGYPVVDIRVTLVDGKAHSVDSSDFAFQMAGGLACGSGRGRRGGPARADRRGDRGGARRSGGRGDERSGRPARPRAGNRQGRRRPNDGQGRDSGGRAHPLRDRPTITLPRCRGVQPRVRPIRADARRRRGPGPQGGLADRRGVELVAARTVFELDAEGVQANASVL
ncbi:elongation factor G [Mycolicibacterium conceptionense]|uniref:Elongation factor G n=1 Tax=Mycolicibacterium conceptionense TaxID=451644 RepID=A0A0U1CY05_9MYCO|nr:elongation factor G [Mycolicibacterium conceptionense]